LPSDHLDGTSAAVTAETNRERRIDLVGEPVVVLM
jgi:hypothetical protein